MFPTLPTLPANCSTWRRSTVIDPIDALVIATTPLDELTRQLALLQFSEDMLGEIDEIVKSLIEVQAVLDDAQHAVDHIQAQVTAVLPLLDSLVLLDGLNTQGRA